MMRGPADPKGFYKVLGLTPDADTGAVKAAYRARAKEVHPDHNPSEHAAEAFALLNEAYQVLSDPRRRASYDAGGTRRPRPGSGARPRPGAASAGAAGAGPRTGQRPPGGAGASPGPGARKAGARDAAGTRDSARDAAAAQAAAQAAARTAAQQTRAAAARAAQDPLTPCRRCGKATAQPRHLIFRKVTGRIRRSVVERLEGTFCHRCAQVTAVRASFATWLTGWWSLPRGPLDTLMALVVNLRGGEQPAEENRALLVQQARAFLARREMELARGCAEQAAAFVRNGADRREVEHLLGIIPRSPRRLRDRWKRPGWAVPVQLLPLVILLTLLPLLISRLTDTAGARALLSPAPATPREAAVTPPGALTIEEGRLNLVTAERLSVRTGPGMAYRAAAFLDRGASVLVTELSPDGSWARVLTAEGLTGFVEAAGLRRMTPGQ